MRSFVSKKGEVKTKPYLTSMSLSYLLHIALYFLFKVTKELQERLGKLESMYKSGVNELDNLASQLDRNSESTFSNLKSELSRNSYAFGNV